MKKESIWQFGLALAFALSLALTGCGGGGDVAVNPDSDGDGIPNAFDAAPNNPALFIDNVTVPLTAGTIATRFSAATAINGSGKVVGYAENAAGEIKAASWAVTVTGGTVAAPAITLAPAAGVNTYSAAYSVNTAGVTVGETENGANIVGAMWPATAANNTAATPLNMTGFAAGSAYGINNVGTGQIVGEARTAGGNFHAVVWNNATAAPVDLGLLAGGTTSAAYAINDGGLVVGEADTAAGATHAVAWRVNTAGAKVLGPVDLGVIQVADVASIALDVDNAGRVVGESDTAAGVTHAGMWTLNAATLVPSTKVNLGADGSATAITETGRIAGTMGATDLATVWDTRKTTLSNNAGNDTTAASQALGMNDRNMVVGLKGTQAFVSVPK